VSEAAATLVALGQQVLQQQQGGNEQPTVCFAIVPLLVPALAIAAHAAVKQVRRLRPAQ
jgi:hypothetical protein